MSKLNRADQIWILKPTKGDRRKAARYASRTLPWTFDRMMKNTVPRGQQERALNIAKGIIVQEALARKLKKSGIKVRLQRKSYRSEDLFDFRVAFRRRTVLFDVKSTAYYSDYPGDEREPFSSQLVIRNKGYPGPDWRIFFPMLIPHTQILQSKEGYIFCMTKSMDFRRTIMGHRSTDFIAAFPYGDHLPFYTYRRLCKRREEVSKGIYTRVLYDSSSLFSERLHARVLYEWDEKPMEKKVMLRPGERSETIGPMSVFNCLEISPDSYRLLEGQIICETTRNQLKEEVASSSGVNINELPESPLVFTRETFCNLILPEDYEVYVLGWIEKSEFLERCRHYPAWVWPLDSVNRYENQPWTQITKKDRDMLDRAGFAGCVSRSPTRLNAGLLKTSGRGAGANCYVFPNIHQSGVRETNLYVLPQDLEIMSEFAKREKYWALQT